MSKMLVKKCSTYFINLALCKVATESSNDLKLKLKYFIFFKFIRQYVNICYLQDQRNHINIASYQNGFQPTSQRSRTSREASIWRYQQNNQYFKDRIHR